MNSAFKFNKIVDITSNEGTNASSTFRPQSYDSYDQSWSCEVYEELEGHIVEGGKDGQRSMHYFGAYRNFEDVVNCALKICDGIDIQTLCNDIDLAVHSSCAVTNSEPIRILTFTLYFQGEKSGKKSNLYKLSYVTDKAQDWILQAKTKGQYLRKSMASKGYYGDLKIVEEN